MKKYISIGVLLLATLCTLSSCRDQDEIYQEFVTVGGKRYPQVTENASGRTGYYKAFISWQRPIDPSVAKTVVTWWEGVEQQTVTIEGSEYPLAQDNTVGVYIENLDESDYTFYLYTEDSEGNKSVQSDVSVTVRGDVFLESLNDRPIQTMTVESNGTCVITWGAKPASLSRTEVKYMSTDGEKTVSTPATTSTTRISDYDFTVAQPITYRSVFADDNWCEEFFRPWATGSSFTR